jgi:hypothetical protein
VERPDRQVVELPLAEQALEALLHLARRLVREGHGEDRARRDALADQEGDPVRQHPRLAGSCTGEDEQRAHTVRDGGALLRIQWVEYRVGHRSDGMCGSLLWTERGQFREPVDNAVVELWRRGWSARARGGRLPRNPEELASGGVIPRRRRLGISLSS